MHKRMSPHGDSDHALYALELINNFKVENVYFNNGNINYLENRIVDLLNKKEINYANILNNMKIDNINIYFLNNNDYKNENDNSNVMYLIIDNYKFLFTGDASKNIENNIINKYNLNNIDVLKVGHHGSNTSSSNTFIY